MRRVEIAALIVYICSAVIALAAFGRSMAIGVAAGGALSLLNFDLSKRIVRKVFADPAIINGTHFLFLIVKLGLVAGALWVVIASGLAHPVGVAVGLSVVIAAIAAQGFVSLRDERAPISQSDCERPASTKPRYVSDAELERDTEERILR